jgi:predicted DNA-binding transcriptional regulator YafY
VSPLLFQAAQAVLNSEQERLVIKFVVTLRHTLVLAMNSSHRLVFLRYIVIDECLFQATNQDSNAEGEKIWFKEDLLEEINTRIAGFSVHTKPIAMRTLEKDLVDMQMLFDVKVRKLSRNRRAHYCYERPGMSIRHSALSTDHAMALQKLFAHLESFHFINGQEWWWEAESRLRVHFDLFSEDAQSRSRGRNANTVEAASVFEDHLWPDASRKWLPVLSKAAAKARPVRLGYRARHDAPLSHATCLAEWLTCQREEWMLGLLAWDDEAQDGFRMLMPLKSIDSVDDITAQFPVDFKQMNGWSWSKYALQRMGLSAGVIEAKEQRTESVQIWLSEHVASRFMVDPIHPSQDMRLQRAGGGVIFTIDVIVDDSLIQWLMQWGSEAQLLEPAEARHTLRLKSRELAQLYEPMFGP